MSNNSPNRFERETHLYPLLKTLEILHVDHFGPFQKFENNYKHILVDAYTRFIWLFSTKSTGSKETIKYLQSIIDTFGKPLNIVSDRGTAFTSKEFEEFIKLNGIHHRQVAVAAPWANGIAERTNRFLKSLLKQ